MYAELSQFETQALCDKKLPFLGGCALKRVQPPKNERFLAPSSTGPFHRVKRWYLRRRLTSVILWAKQIPEVFRKARSAFFKLGCLVFSGFEYPLKIISAENPGAKRSKSRCLRRSLISVIFGVRQIPEVFQQGHVLLYNAGYLYWSQTWIRWKLCTLKNYYIIVLRTHFTAEHFNGYLGLNGLRGPIRSGFALAFDTAP
jgi:hypothetical protein